MQLCNKGAVAVVCVVALASLAAGCGEQDNDVATGAVAPTADNVVLVPSAEMALPTGTHLRPSPSKPIDEATARRALDVYQSHRVVTTPLEQDVVFAEVQSSVRPVDPKSLTPLEGGFVDGILVVTWDGPPLSGDPADTRRVGFTHMDPVTLEILASTSFGEDELRGLSSKDVVARDFFVPATN